jgi:RNA polymerase sigma-70 factor (ECF subfamily)
MIPALTSPWPTPAARPADASSNSRDTARDNHLFPLRPLGRKAGARIAVGQRGQAISELEDIDTLVRTYRAKLLRFITYSTGDPDLAETLAQDCLLKAWNARESFRGESSINTWLTSIALNLIRDHQRTLKFKFWKQARATAIDVNDVASFVAADETSAETRLIAREQVGRLSGILETLSANQRTAFLLKFSEELDLPQIAEAMNMPVNTVKTHLHRALKAVRSQLAAAAGTSAAAKVGAKP